MLLALRFEPSRFFLKGNVGQNYREESLKGQYRHDQSRLSTGHGIGVLV